VTAHQARDLHRQERAAELEGEDLHELGEDRPEERARPEPRPTLGLGQHPAEEPQRGDDEEHFARARRILDLWHMERQLSRGLKAAIGDKAELARQRAQLGRLIRSGQVEPVLARLRALAEQQPTVGVGEGGEWAVPAVPQELFATIRYVEGHRDAIVDYKAEMAAGEHVGSGAVEKAGDLVVNRRFKGRRGMRWWRRSADGILALRILHLNGDWHAYWHRRCQPQPTAA